MIISKLNFSYKNLLLLSLLIFLLFCCNSSAYAKVAVSPAQGINDVSEHFKTILETLMSYFEDGARNLFLGLAIIALVWSFGQMALKGGELNNVIFELVKTCMTVGFFWWLITQCSDVLFSIFSKFGHWGGDASQFSIKSPVDLITAGASTASDLLVVKGGIFDMAVWVSSVCGLLFGIFIFISSVLLAVNIIIQEIEFYIFCYIGIFVLGLSGSNWTRDIAIAYLKKLIAISVQYFSTCLLAGIAFNVMTNYSKEIEKLTAAHDVSGTILAELNVLAVFLVVIKIQRSVPQGLSALFGGGSSGGYDAGGIAGRVTGAVAGAAGGVAGKMLAAAGGAGAMSLAKSIGGGIAKSGTGQKLGAAIKSAGNSIAQGYKNSALSQTAEAKAFTATAGAAGKAMSAAGKAMAQSLRNSFTPGGAGVTAQRAGNSAMSDMADTVKKMGEKMGVDK